MAVSNRPGVFIEESFRAAPTAVAPAGAVGAMVMATKKGPTTIARLITGFSEFEDVYGGFYAGFFGPHHVRAFFDEGGSQLWVGRVVEAGVAALVDLDVASAGAAGADLRLEAIFEGAEGNSIRFDLEVGAGTVAVASSGATTVITASVLAGVAIQASSVTGADDIRFIRKEAGAGLADIELIDAPGVNPPTIGSPGGVSPTISADLTPAAVGFDIAVATGGDDIEITLDVAGFATFTHSTGGGSATVVITRTGTGTSGDPWVFTATHDGTALVSAVNTALNTDVLSAAFLTSVIIGAGGDTAGTAAGPTALTSRPSVQDIVDAVNGDATLFPRLSAEVIVGTVSPAGNVADTAVAATAIPDTGITVTALAALLNANSSVNELITATVLQNGAELVEQNIASTPLAGGSGSEIAFGFVTDMAGARGLTVAAANAGRWGNGVGVRATKFLTSPRLVAAGVQVGVAAPTPITSFTVENSQGLEPGDRIRIEEETPKHEVATLTSPDGDGSIRLVTNTLDGAFSVVVGPDAGLTESVSFDATTRVLTIAGILAGTSTNTTVVAAINAAGIGITGVVVAAGTSFSNTGSATAPVASTAVTTLASVDALVAAVGIGSPATITIITATPPADGIAAGASVHTASQHKVGSSGTVTTAAAITDGQTTVTLTIGNAAAAARLRQSIGNFISFIDAANDVAVTTVLRAVDGTTITFDAVTLGVSTIDAGSVFVTQEFVLNVFSDEATGALVPTEVHEFLSMSADSRSDYVDNRLSGISNRSTLVTVVDFGSASPTLDRIPAPQTGLQLLRRGQDGAFPSDATHIAGLTLFDAVDNINTISVPGVTSSSVGASLATYAANRTRKSLAVLGTPIAVDTINEASDYRTGTLGIDSSHAALYWPAVRVPDLELNDGSVRDQSPEGHVQGMMSSVAANRGPHKAPANEALATVIGLVTDGQSVNFDSAQEILNPLGVNVIRPIAGFGIRVFGARTLSTIKDGSHEVHKRLVLNIIESALISLGNQLTFEPNPEDSAGLGNQLVSGARSFLRSIWLAGWLTPSSDEGRAFFVKSDAENNPPAVIAAGQRIVDVGVRIVGMAEQIIFRVSAVQGAVSVQQVSA